MPKIKLSFQRNDWSRDIQSFPNLHIFYLSECFRGFRFLWWLEKQPGAFPVFSRQQVPEAHGVLKAAPALQGPGASLRNWGGEWRLSRDSRGLVRSSDCGMAAMLTCRPHSCSQHPWHPEHSSSRVRAMRLPYQLCVKRQNFRARVLQKVGIWIYEYQQSVMAHICKPSTREAEAGRLLWVQSQPELHVTACLKL